MIYLFSDLDNTLIYSHRRKFLAPKVAVEWLCGKEQSYISQKAFKFFSSKHYFELIPVTSRTQSQYLRLIPIMESFHSKVALVCNGGKLIINGESNKQWINKTYEIIREEVNETYYAGKLLEKKSQYHTLKTDEELFFYLSDPEPEQLSKKIKQSIDVSKVSVMYDNRKVYCFPHSLNKGQALKRFLELFPCDYSIVAGDSLNDYPMVEYSNCSIFPSSIESMENIKYICPDNMMLCDYICDVLNNIFI